jgi:hypothetical protein
LLSELSKTKKKKEEKLELIRERSKASESEKYGYDTDEISASQLLNRVITSLKQSREFKFIKNLFI